VASRDCHIEFTGDTLKMPISDDLMGAMPQMPWRGWKMWSVGVDFLMALAGFDHG
jgi:hypothetical protein